MDPQVVRAALDDWRTAPIGAKLRAALAYLEKVTTQPDEWTAADARAALDAGIAAEALREVVYVCFLFSVLNRCTDAFGFGTPTPDQARRVGWLIDHFGYRAAQLPG